MSEATASHAPRPAGTTHVDPLADTPLAAVEEGASHAADAARAVARRSSGEDVANGTAYRAGDILALQRVVGNSAVARMLGDVHVSTVQRAEPDPAEAKPDAPSASAAAEIKALTAEGPPEDEVAKQRLAQKDAYIRRKFTAGPEGPKLPDAAVEQPSDFKDFESLYAASEEAVPMLKETTKALAAATDGKAVMGPLKTRDKALPKIKNDYGGNLRGILDLVRATIEYDTLRDAYAGLWAAFDNGIVVRGKNRFQSPAAAGTGYRDALLNVKLPNGIVGELQMHVATMRIAKENEHDWYNEIIKIEQAATQENRPLKDTELARINELRAKALDLYDKAWGEILAKEGKQA